MRIRQMTLAVARLRHPYGRLPRMSGRFVASILITGVLEGCGSDATLTRETPTSGVVTFAIRTDADVLASNGRRDALRMIREKCPRGSHIVKEGEIPKVSAAVDRTWRGQMGSDRVWGIQFTCE